MQCKRRGGQQQQPPAAAAPHHHHQHQQPVQDESLRHLNLPPSIPVSRDGEEGAVVYNLRIQQSNADAKPECYQPPPNRTVPRGDGNNDGLSAYQYSTSTPSLKQLAASSPTQLDLLNPSSSSFSSHSFSASLSPPRPSLSPKIKGQTSFHRTGQSEIDGGAEGGGGGVGGGGGDYVSGCLLSTWRVTSPDRRRELSKSIIPSGGLLPCPVAGSTGAAVQPASVEGALESVGEGAEGGGQATDSEDPSKRPKQRSSSADSVRRLVAKCSLLRFAKKHSAAAAATKTSKSQPSVTLVDSQKAHDKVGGHPKSVTAETPGGAAAKEPQTSAPWELPPNYVDMIFTKDPTTIDSKKETIVKQQPEQQQQQQQQQQPKRPKHCCTNS